MKPRQGLPSICHSARDALVGPRSTAPVLLLLGFLCLSVAVPVAAIDLRHATLDRLENGLTLVVLEDPTFPVVSVQMLYRVGARDEDAGRTGLAHFLEHMAFRASERFPDTEIVSAIYAVGGEWHGYTWIDQTTYFETVPKEYLDLVLRIEADRLARLLIPAADVEAERGAVLAELHGYENDPGTVLLDMVAATSFLQHPYRNNTIGWESDVERVEHRDLVDFYRRHYHPANAVLAVVGDVHTQEVKARVHEIFGPIDAGQASAPLRTIEPEQWGERRIELRGPNGAERFVIAYRAPSVRSPDWPVFLVLQEILGGGDGVNFLQNEWGVPVQPGSRLDGITADLSSWYPPSYDPYLFVLSGSRPSDLSATEIEDRIESSIADLRRQSVSAKELGGSRSRVLESLVFDVQTTEDAAHQLASYAGYGALSELLELPAAIQGVSATDIQRLAATLLDPRRRTIGWYRVGDTPGTQAELESSSSGVVKAAGLDSAVAQVPSATREDLGFEKPGAPEVRRLANGLTVLFQRVRFSPTACVRIAVASNALEFAADSQRNWPLWGSSSIGETFLASELEETLQELRDSLTVAAPLEPVPPETIEDPEARLEATFEELLGIGQRAGRRQPFVIVVAGDLQLAATLTALERTFGDLEPGEAPEPEAISLRSRELRVRLAAPKAQAQLGYLVTAPPPARPDALAWRMLLYVLSHGYEGRLGKEAISRRGLLYYIDSSYHTDGRAGWITLAMGVDPAKVPPLEALLVESLTDLESHPPTTEEIDEARQHLLGRRRSAAQSNPEIAAALLSEWVQTGRLLSEEEFFAAVQAVDRQDVLRVIPEFVSGAVVVVEVPEE